jgi:uridylate kinase
MDTAAIALARENRLPIVVFNMHEADSIAHVLDGKGKFTVITAAKAAA